MAVARIKQKDTANAYYTEFTVDKERQISELPVQPECATGSIAVCIDSGAVYILNSLKQWIKQPGGGTDPEDPYSYNDLVDKPTLNEIEISGDKTLEDYGIPTDTADLTNSAGFQNAEEVQQAIADNVVILQYLPLEGIENTRYLIENDYGTYDEYRLLNNQWVLISTRNTVAYKSTSEWASYESDISEEGILYIYSDYKTNTPGIKIGDGITTIGNLSFITGAYDTHIADSTIHITSTERTDWNNKVTCYVSQSNPKNLVFSKN